MRPCASRLWKKPGFAQEEPERVDAVALTMRGPDVKQDTLFSTVSPEQRALKDHPLRPIRRIVDQVLKALNGEFHVLYTDLGRGPIPP